MAHPKPPTVHLVAIGNELLNGETRDTNLAWLIRWVSGKGGHVVRAAIIPDDPAALKWELGCARGQGTGLFITTGGLGPTDDDRTHESIARCIGCGTELGDEALQFVRERIEAIAKFHPGLPLDLTKERKSMAILPIGGKPLMNPVGVAPGMIYVADRITLIALPGVPREMKGIVKETLKPFWKEFFAGICYVKRNITVKGIPEADLWPFIRKTIEMDPYVYIKSKLRMVGNLKKVSIGASSDSLPWRIIVHFSVTDKTRREGIQRINQLVDALVDKVRSGYGSRVSFDLS